MARKMFPGMRASLDALCKRFKIDNSSRKLHGALKDAALLAEVYVELMGGRQESFSIHKTKKMQKTSFDGKNKANELRVTKLIEPTKEELQKHKEFLAKINNPLWLNY
jgi:DNA polymerase-3 subunit epsilon